jgi:hypothetical protein
MNELTTLLGRDYILPEDVPRLVAAIEAVLAKADEWAVPLTPRPLLRREYAAEVFRAAITAALVGPDSNGVKP